MSRRPISPEACRARRWLLGSLACGLAVVGTLGWVLVAEPWRPRIRLADGRQVVYCGVTVGRTHENQAVPLSQRLLSRHFPRLFDENTLLTSNPPDSPVMVVWGRAERWMLDDFSITARDEHGCVLGVHDMSGAPSLLAVLNTWPRRGGRVRVAIHHSRTFALLAGLTVPAPPRGNFPDWTPEAFPIRKRVGDLELEVRRPPKPEVGPFPGYGWRLPLVVRERNRISTGWRVDSQEVRDATGNGKGGQLPTKWKPPDQFRLFSLCCRERALDVRVRLIRDWRSPRRPDRVWALPLIPVGEEGPQRDTRVASPGREVVVSSRWMVVLPHSDPMMGFPGGPGSESANPPSGKSSGHSPEATRKAVPDPDRGHWLRLELTWNAPREGTTLRLISARDEQGRSPRVGSVARPGESWSDQADVQGTQAATLDLVCTTRTQAVRLRFGMDIPREFRFRIAPPDPP